jgi:dTDP-4-dehydrorhamnose 3,5-epimerase
MDIKPFRLSGAFGITLEPKRDQRGYFLRSYDETIFAQHGLINHWVQENEALSMRKGIIRGLHFQRPPHAETKLVRVIQGAVLDVFVDLRRSSPTYGQWEMAELSEENHRAVYIPKGFAHGYCALTDISLVLYKVDALYNAGSEGGLRWNDSALAIPWPVTEPVLSAKDIALPTMNNFVSPFA